MGVIWFAVAVKVMAAGLKVTPAGASPPAAGVASTVFAPAVAPSVQQTLALPFASVAVAALSRSAAGVRDGDFRCDDAAAERDRPADGHVREDRALRRS